VNTKTAFSPEEMKAIYPNEKVGLLATINPDGLPHLTLITSFRAKTPTQLMWGQFVEGESKKHIARNPRTGWLIMTMDQRMWRGKADYHQALREGEDYIAYNDIPMFRYNSYFGVHTVHYMDVREFRGPEKLALGAIIPASLLTGAAKATILAGPGERVLNPWSEKMFNRMDSIKFLGFLDADGYPVIVPLLQCRAADSRRLVFSPLAYGKDLARLPEGAPAAVFAMNMQMEDVLARGLFRGMHRRALINLGMIELDWVYNSMPPKMGQIYPPVELTAVTDF